MLNKVEFIRKRKTAIVFFAFCFLLFTTGLNAFDLFALLDIPDQPVAIKSPAWVLRGSELKLSYSTREYYRRWIDGKMVNDFSGHQFGVDLSMQLLDRFYVGGRKKFLAPHTWENLAEDKSSRFSLISDSQSGEGFFGLNLKSCSVEIGGGSGKGHLEGSYDLHRDIINALGESPPVFLDNGHVNRYIRVYAEPGDFRLSLSAVTSKVSYRAAATTPALAIALNHEQKIETHEAELAWSGFYQLVPFIRYYSIIESGSGDNFKNEKYRFGSNTSRGRLSSLSVGASARIKKSNCFVEFSRLNSDLELTTRFNLITLNPLFLFGTNEVDYRLDIKPENPWGLRIGANHRYRKIDFDAQYSYISLSGRSNIVSRKSYNMFSATASDYTVQEIDLGLHRLTIGARRNDRQGCWTARLNLLVPVASSEEIKPPLPPAPPGPPPVSSAPKPEETIRGGWQLQICREFKL